MRLDRFLSNLPQINRQTARQLLASGRVRVDGAVVCDGLCEVSQFSRIEIDSELLQAGKAARYFMLHKPIGVVSATEHEQHRTVLDLLDEPDKADLHLAGRLDLNTSGLLLITNDGQWSRRLTEPRSRLGKVLVAIRDREDRVRFSGYDPAMFKAFIFAVAALFSSVGGAMFTLQVGLASPSLVGIVPSVEMVIYAAVGGRLSLVGAVYGAVLVGSAKTFFSENFVEYWMYFIGLLFVVIVMFLPDGLAGLLDKLTARKTASGTAGAGAATAGAAK